MRLTLNVQPYQRRFRTPLHTAHGFWRVRQGLILRLTDEAGRRGYGEVAPLPWFGTETLEVAMEFCQSLAGSISKVECLPVPGELPCCQFAIATALEQVCAGGGDAGRRGDEERGREGGAGAQGRRRDRESERWGDGEGRVVETRGGEEALGGLEAGRVCGLLPAGEEALAAWEPLWAKGHRTFKWKVGVYSLDEELAWFEGLLRSMPVGAKVRLDANGRLSVAEAQAWLTRCDGAAGQVDAGQIDSGQVECAQVEYVEQPLAPADFSVMLELSRQYQTRIALDESVATLGHLEAVYRQGWPGLVVIKPAIAGDPSAICDFCARYAIDPVASSVFETPIGLKGALGVAQRLGSSRALGFGTTGYFEDDWDTLANEALWRRLI